MKKGIFLMSGILLALMSSAQVSFSEVNSTDEWELILQKAAEKNQNIFIDVTADWCGFCKMMDRDVFSDGEVGEYLNGSFIPVKIDADLTFGSTFSAKHGISGLPTFLVMNAKENVIDKLVGYQGKEELFESLKASETAVESTSDLLFKFENGNLNTKSMMMLTKRLKQNSDPRWEEVTEVTTEALLDKRYLSEDEMDFIAFYPIAVSSPNYSRVIDPYGVISKEYIYYFLYESMMEQLYKAIDATDISILDALKDQMLPAYCEGDKELELYTVGMLKRFYYLGVDDLDGYDQVVLEEHEKHFQDHEFYFYNEASNLYEFADDSASLELVRKYAQLYMDEQNEDLDGYSLLMFTNASLGNLDNSYELLEKAHQVATTEEEKETVNFMEEMLGEF